MPRLQKILVGAGAAVVALESGDAVRKKDGEEGKTGDSSEDESGVQVEVD